MNLRSAFFSLATATLLGFSAASSQAGGFGGPGPFRNGSPLPTGTDGVYSAVANGTNLTGLFYFSIRGGVQTQGSGGNSWVFFVDGQTLRGTTAANVANGKVVGVLDSGLSTSVTNDDGDVSLPIVIYIQGNNGNGYFQGQMDMGSPTGYFDGKGQITGTPDRTDQIVIVSEDVISLTENGTDTQISPVAVVAVPIPGSSLGDVNFKFRGSRLSTSTSTAVTGNSTTTN